MFVFCFSVLAHAHSYCKDGFSHTQLHIMVSSSEAFLYRMHAIELDVHLIGTQFLTFLSTIILYDLSSLSELLLPR